MLVYGLLLSWRVIARLYFRIKKDWQNGARRVLVVGVGPLGQRVGEQIKHSELEDLSLIGFADDGYKPVDESTVVLGENDFGPNYCFSKKNNGCGDRLTTFRISPIGRYRSTP